MFMDAPHELKYIVMVVLRDPYGKRIVAKQYKNEHGAKIAMGKLSDGWKEENKNVHC